MTSLIKPFKCDCCAYVSNSNKLLWRHYQSHKQQLNKDIINYVDYNRQLKSICKNLLKQTWDISNVLTIKDLMPDIIYEMGWKRNIFYFKKPSINEIDFVNCISKCIRNEYGISNTNGNFIGLSHFTIDDFEDDDPNNC